MRRAARTDANHRELAAAFRACGYSVLDLSRVGGGCLDLLVARHHRSTLVEIKSEDGELNALQKDFIAGWRGDTAVVRTLEDVQKFATRGLAQ